MKNLNNYKNLYEDIGVGILLSDVDGNIFEINDTARELLSVRDNITESLKIGKSVLHRILKEDHSTYNEEHPVLNTLRNKKQLKNQIIGVYNDEAKLSWLSLNVVINSEADSNYFIITLYDITPYIQSLNRLNKEFDVAIKKAEESDRLRAAFLANMSHEIRTPLNGILGFSELLKVKDISDGDVKQYAEIIFKSGNKLLNIIDDLINISNIESGAVNISKEKVYFNYLLKNLHKEFTKKALNIGVEFEYDFGLPDNECIIETDEYKLERIISILIKNSLKFTKKGKIIFGYEVLYGNQPEVRFYVRDTGIGIPKAMQEMIFKPFIQADTSYNRAYEGAGLGLAISKKYVELLGGKIWVDSEVGQGSTFFFTVPGLLSVKEVEHQSNNSVIANNILKGMTILIADDDKVSTWLIRESLKGLDVKIIYAENGRKAVELVKGNPDIQLVIMDVQMPVLNGIEATKMIKDFRPELPVIGQTAFILSDDVKAGFESGWDDYLTKPIEIAHLLQKVQNFALG